MNVKIEITLTNDEYTEEAEQIQVQIEEHIALFGDLLYIIVNPDVRKC